MSNYEDPEASQSSKGLASTRRVEVVLGVMSRCPDALYFETLFSRTVERVNSKMHLTLSYIGQEDSKARYGVACKHGDLECAGNIHQLCVADALDGKTAGERWDLSPSAAQRRWWDFVSCQDFEGGLKGIGSESLVKQCLDVTDGPKWEKDGIRECAEGKNGTTLLLESVQASHRLGIEKSATLQIEGKTVCIRDDAQWKDCPGGHEPSDWARQIEEAWDRINNASLASAAVSTGLYQAPMPAITPAVAERPSGLTFQKRQATQTGAMPPQNTGNGILGVGGGGGTDRQTPLSIFTFIVAIALFVLVVLFVLLRIYIRNRRLRALGLFPEGPIERFLGASSARAEMEDTLVPPKLWEAKIVDVHRTSKVATEPARGHGWDALMPVSAALPPSFYPLAAEELEKAAAARAAAQAAEQRQETTYPPPRNPQAPAAWSFGRGGAARSQGRNMRPRFFRRNRSGNGDEAMELGAANGSSGAANAASTDVVTSSTTDNTPPDQRLPTSVNVTVLIAMPSERTVFPSSRKPIHAMSQASMAYTAPEAVDEDDEERTTSSDDKGKARRAPSLRSVRSRASIKSVGEARREAFFGAEAQDDAQDVLDAADYDEDDEDEELPELVFGTASVPVFARLAGATTASPAIPPSASRAGYLSTPASELAHPEKRQLVELITAANEARDRKAREAAAAAKAEEAKKRSEEVSGNSNAAAAGGAAVGNGAASAGGSRAAGASSSSVEEGQGGLASGAANSTYERPSLAGDTTSPSMDMLRPQTEAPAQLGLASDPVTRLSTHNEALRELAEREARGERQGRGGLGVSSGRPTPREIIAAGGLVNGAGHSGM